MSNLHAILSDLHGLLSTYGREDFLEASRYPGLGRSLKEALLALASESPANSRLTSTAPNRKTKHPVEALTLDSSVLQDRPGLFDLILKSEYGTTVSSLREFVAKQGIKLDSRPKESKERLVKRLVAVLIDLPESRRNQVLADLLGKVSSQTQGWINVIKGKKL